MGRKRRKLVDSCWMGRDYVQVHRCLQRTVTRTQMADELDLKEGDTLVYLMEHDDNESWWLAEDVKGQVGYVPAAYLMIILDEFLHEEESGKEAHEKRTDGTKIGGEMGLDGERR